jgi:hypothetical protein
VVSHPSGSAVPRSSIDKEQPNDQYKQQDREPVGAGKHQPENQSAQHSGGSNEPEQHSRPDAGHHEQERQQQQHYGHHRDSQQQLPEDHCNLRIRGSTGLRRKEQQIRDQNPNLSID